MSAHALPKPVTHRALFNPHSGYARCRNTEVTAEKAEIGSEQLRQAMRREFGRLALKHGISVNDARLLLMNGVGL